MPTRCTTRGGLLDINHTGYPSASSLAHIGAKPAPGYADLTQLGLAAADVDKLLGWRQYATLQATGNFPNLQPSITQADAAYYQFLLANPASLLQVPLTLWNGRTDQTFLSRQQLIGYFTAVLPKSLSSLQYLGTFNRGLNQPSYAPEPAYNPAVIRPLVLDKSAGGNDSATNTSINPNFLTAVVQKAFSRPDGVTPARNALAGEPLVKQRFPLIRLAWLTYKGPSAERNLGEADMAALINTYNVTSDYLKQGTRTNIAYYFGLQWDPTTKWTYIHGSNGSTGAILNILNPNKPLDVVRLSGGNTREPDFFELLKASINPGSLAKSSLDGGILNPPPNPADAASGRAAIAQYSADTSLDAAILQVGANIIDQFDTDGFPTQINYDLGTGTPSAVYGVENLPYISRVRSGLLRVVQADPPETGNGKGPDGTVLPFKNTGVGVLMNYPEVWNPHAWSSFSSGQNGVLAQTFGAVAPQQFKIYAETVVNNGIQQSTSVYAWNVFGTPPPVHHNSYDADPAQSPGFQDKYGFGFGTPARGRAARPAFSRRRTRR